VACASDGGSMSGSRIKTPSLTRFGYFDWVVSSGSFGGVDVLRRLRKHGIEKRLVKRHPVRPFGLKEL